MGKSKDDINEMGLIYIFNLMVGTGALVLPSAFVNSGWILGLAVLVAMAIISFTTMTFVVESMAAANAILRNRRTKEQQLLLNQENEVINATDDMNLISEDADIEDESCDIQERIEMGRLAGLFFNKVGTALFFACIAIFLYGNLSIFEATVGESLREVACTYYPDDTPCNETLDGSVACWQAVDISRDNAYRLFVSIFVLILGTFGFFDVQTTKLLQVLTTVIRWAAMITMITLACVRLVTFPLDQLGNPPFADINGIPNLFGTCIYSFKCHLSIPPLVTPISPKRGLYKFLAADYVVIAGFYLLLVFTGIFAFPHVEDLYTLNFTPDRCRGLNSTVDSIPSEAANVGQQILYYFLALFPVFTLSTSFPIITITLRNNLKQLCLSRPESEYNFFIRRLLFPLLAIIPPTVLALNTSNISLLVGITGSYAGVGVQYVIPALMAYYARKVLAQEFSDPAKPVRNTFSSPFQHVFFIIFVLIWAVACVAFVTYNHIVTGK